MDLSLKTLIRFIFATTIIPIGLVCNIIALIIFKRQKLNQRNIFGYLYSWLCMFDILSLLNEMVFAFLEYLNIELIAYSNITCKTLFGWVKYVNHLPSFQIIIIAFYLYVTICHHNKRDKFHKNRLKLILLMISFVTLVDLVYVIYDKHVIYNSYENKTTFGNKEIIEYKCETVFLLDFILDITNVIMRDFIPFILIFVLNYLSIKGFLKSKSNSNQRVNKKDYQFFRSIIGSNLIFLTIYFPWAIVFILYHIHHSFDMFDELIESDQFEVIKRLFECFAYLNNMTCFFLNMCLNSRFLSEFLYLFKLRREISSDGISTNHFNNI